MYRFIKPVAVAVADYVVGVERDYNKAVILEYSRMNDTREIETDKYIVTIYYTRGYSERLKIKRKDA